MSQQNLDNKSDAVVNILDEILEVDLEDLGGDEAATKKGRRRSQRFSQSENSKGDANADDDSTGPDVGKKAKKGSSAMKTGKQVNTRSGSNNTNSNEQNNSVSEPANKKSTQQADENNKNSSSSGGNKITADEDAESSTELNSNETKVKAEPDDAKDMSNNNHESNDDEKPAEAGSSNEETARDEEDKATNNQDDHNYESGSDVSSSDDDEHSQISNPSLSSASFGSESATRDSPSSDKKGSSPVPGSDKQQKQLKKEYAARLSYILRDARFFLMKSNNGENVTLSKTKGVWATPPANEAKINQALKEARNVLLIFSVKESGKFSGFARLASESNRSGQSVNWILPPGLSQRALGGIFNIDWISKNDVLFNKTQHLFNPWNDGKPVKIGRDGQEIEPHVASELCRLFPMDTNTDWINILKKSKEAAKKVNHTKVIAPLGSNSSSALGPRVGGRGGGLGGRDSTSRGRFAYTYRNGRNNFSNDFGRGVRRRFNEESYVPRPKRSRGSYDYHYKGGYGDRGNDMNSNHRFARERGYTTSARKVRTYEFETATSHIYPDYVVRDYHHQRPPPPMPPLSYPPPPPFDNLPPPPRYYDGPPLPEFPVPRTSIRDRRSASPYEKSVTEFLRRTGDRRERERGRERERERERERKSYRR